MHYDGSRESLLEAVSQGYSSGSTGTIYSPSINFDRCPTCGTYVTAEALQRQSERSNYFSQLQQERDSMYQQLSAERSNFFNEISSLKKQLEKSKHSIVKKVKMDELYDRGYTDDEIETAIENRKLFTVNRYCKTHRSYECVDCLKSEIMKIKNELLPSIIAEPSHYKREDKEVMKQNFLDQVEFVRLGLDMSDEDADKIKVKELSEKVIEAQDKITVGKMKKLMDIRIKPLGVIEAIIKFLTKKR